MNEVQFGMNQYCGPAVLSIFTGLDTDLIAQEIMKVSGATRVTGITPSILIKTGESLGLEFKENQAFQDRSLFWTASAIVNFPGNYLLTIPNHYITLEVDNDKKIYICDNHTKCAMDLQNSARLSQKVEKLWKVTKVFDYVVPEKPHVISSEIKIEDDLTLIHVKQINKLSDGGIKIKDIASIYPTEENNIEQIVSKLYHHFQHNPPRRF